MFGDDTDRAEYPSKKASVDLVNIRNTNNNKQAQSKVSGSWTNVRISINILSLIKQAVCMLSEATTDQSELTLQQAGIHSQVDANDCEGSVPICNEGATGESEDVKKSVNALLKTSLFI